MLTCPHCQKTLRDLERQCPRCRTDLTLLVDYSEHLDTGLERAERLVRAGKLDEAVWEYLQVLEVDPDNPTARKQVGLVATAVRQFDRFAPGRRWMAKLRRGERLRRWVDSMVRDGDSPRWLALALVVILIFAGAVGGFWLGFALGQQHPAEAAAVESAAK